MWSLAMNQFLYWVVVSVFCSKAKNSQGKPDLFGKETDRSFSYKFIPLDLMPIQAKQAALMKSCLPPSLLQMIDANTWPGEALMAQNYCFLKPLIMNHPRKAVILGQKMLKDYAGFILKQV